MPANTLESLATNSHDEKVSILIVDDKRGNLVAMQVVFASSGYEVIQASSGAEALAAVEKKDFAVILMDVQMPGLDGFETARRLRRTEFGSHIPIIFVTAIHRDERYLHRGYEAGGVDYLFKPFDIEVLRAKVSVFVDLYRAKRLIARQAEVIRQKEKVESDRALIRERARGRVREEAALEKHRELVNSINHAVIWAADPVTLRVTFVSASADAITGYSPEEWLSDPDFLRKLIHPGERDAVMNQLKNVLVDGRDADLNHRIQRADGKVVWLRSGVHLAKSEYEGGLELRGLSADVTELKGAEASLRQSRDQLRIIFEGVADGIFVQDLNGTVVYANWVAARLLGFSSREEAQKIPVERLFRGFELNDENGTPVSIEKLPCKRALNSDTPNLPQEVFCIVSRTSGEKRWLAFSSRPLLDEAGKAYMSVTIIRDITESRKAVEQLETRVRERTRELSAANQELNDLINAHRRTEEAIRQSELFLASLIENIPSMIFVKDAKDLRFIRFNKAGEDLTGISSKEMIGRTDYDFFPSDQAEFFVSQDRKTLAGARAVDIPEEKIETKRRGSRILHTRKIPILGPGGDAQYLLGISDDITERKQAEDQRVKLAEEKAAREIAERSASRVAFLAKASMLMGSSLDYRTILKNLADLIVSDIADGCVIDTSEDHRMDIAATSFKKSDLSERCRTVRDRYPVQLGEQHEEGYGPAHVIETGRSELYPKIEEVTFDPSGDRSRGFLHFLEELKPCSVMIVPLRIRREVVGVMTILSFSKDRTYDAEDLELLEELARRASLAVENSKLYGEIESKEERLRSFFMQAPAVVTIYRGPQHLIELTNPLGEELLGYRNIIGKFAREALVEFAGEKMLEVLDHVYSTGEAVSVREEVRRVPDSTTGNEKTVYLNTVYQPMRDARGRVDGVMSYSVDVSAQVEARRMIEDQQRWAEAVLNSMPIPMIFADFSSGEVTFANRAADAMAGGSFPKKRPLSPLAPQFRVTDERDRPIPEEKLPDAKIAKGERVHGAELVWHTPVGRFSLLIDTEMLPVMYGRQATTLIALQDVSKLKQIEAQLHEAVRGRDEFLSICSHELKTPITSLKLQIQLVARQIQRGDPRAYEPTRIRRVIETTDRQVDRMSRLIEDMLDVARISTGKLRTEMRTHDFGTLVRDVTDRFGNELVSMRIPLTLDIEPDVFIRADRYRIEQVVTNLLTNAMKYGNRNPIEIHVKKEGPRAIFAIRDHGIGIAKEDFGKIFNRFERAESSGSVSGLGLGLYIVRQILETHQGTVRVESELGQGTTFIVELPVAIEDQKIAS